MTISSCPLINRFFKNLIDPTASPVGLFLYTVRYWIILGIVINRLNYTFVCITAIHLFRASLMYVIYGLHLAEYKKLWLLQALSILDEDRQEYYAVRSSKKI